jgi:hypothetical protein
MSLTEGFLGLRLTKMGGRATSISFSPDASMANQRWQNDSFGRIMGQGTRQGSAATVLRWRLRNLVSLLTHHLAVGSDLRRAVPGKSGAQQTFARFGRSRLRRGEVIAPIRARWRANLAICGTLVNHTDGLKIWHYTGNLRCARFAGFFGPRAATLASQRFLANILAQATQAPVLR